MKLRLVTLLLFSLFAAASANRAWACGSDDADHAAQFHQESSEKPCCSKDEAQTPCADDSKYQHAGSDCPCDHENGGCHCPGCGLTGQSGAAFALETSSELAASTLNISVQKLAFYFADHLPEAVYLPIWQPPKLVA